MKKQIRYTMLCLGLECLSLLSRAQLMVLPDFEAQAVKKGVQLQWTLPEGFPHISRMGVQRSADSLYNFSTIGYAMAAGSKQGQFIDTHPLGDSGYYKLIFVKPDGSYFFSQTIFFHGQTATTISHPEIAIQPVNKPARKDSAVVNRPPAYHPSIYVFTNPSGNITLSLPDAGAHTYHLVFYDSTGMRVLEIPHIGQSLLTLDKSNFLHAGWFHYELYDGNKLIEKWKLYVPDDVQVDSINEESPVRQTKARARSRRR